MKSDKLTTDVGTESFDIRQLEDDESEDFVSNSTMRSWIRRTLTRRISVKVGRRKRTREIELEPSRLLVYGMYFAMVALIALTAVEIVHIVYIGSFSSEIFSAITGLIGTIVGVLLTSKG